MEVDKMGRHHQDQDFWFAYDHLAISFPSSQSLDYNGSEDLICGWTNIDLMHLKDADCLIPYDHSCKYFTGILLVVWMCVNLAIFLLYT